MAEYRKRVQTRIIRTEHRVMVWVGSSASSLKQALSPVPINAKVTDIENGEGSQMVLVFTDEAEDTSGGDERSPK